jgi:predicted secreted Zn-dependent protease
MPNSVPPTLGKITWKVAQKCNEGGCIRVASQSDQILIGDSKNPSGLVLSYTRDEWNAFVEGVRHGDFDEV